jgi:hypothetical protein
MAASFSATRDSEPDDRFLSACGLPEIESAHRIALAVRRSVARYGMVNAEFILATDRYPDELVQLSGWDSLDFLGWVLELERELGQPIQERTAFSQIPPVFSVKDLAWAVFEYLENQDTDNRRAT